MFTRVPSCDPPKVDSTIPLNPPWVPIYPWIHQFTCDYLTYGTWPIDFNKYFDLLIKTWLVVWNVNGLFSHSVGNIIIPTDFIFFTGVETTNQYIYCIYIYLIAPWINPFFVSAIHLRMWRSPRPWHRCHWAHQSAKAVWLVAGNWKSERNSWKFQKKSWYMTLLIPYYRCYIYICIHMYIS